MNRILLAFAALLLAASSPSFATALAYVVGGSTFLTTPSAQYSSVNFQGVPIGGLYGNTDTIVQRSGDLGFGGPSTQSIPIEIVALQLQSVAPVDVGAGTDFHYLTLQSARGGPASTGTMQITLDGTLTGGTFTSNSTLFYDIRKGSLSGPIVISNTSALTNPAAAWTSTPSGLLVDGLYGDLTVNHHTNLSSDQLDLFLGDTGIPEPSSELLLGGGLVAFAVLLRRRIR